MPEAAQAGWGQPFHTPVGGARAPAIGPGDQQRGGVGALAAQRRPGIEEEIEILARLDRAGEEDELLGQPEALPDRDQLAGGGRPEVGGDTVPGDIDAAGRFGPLPGDFAGHGVRDGEDPRRLPDGALEKGHEAEAHSPGQRLGVLQNRQVVQGDDPRHGERAREGQQRRPEEVDIPSRQPPRKIALLPENAERGGLDLDGQPAFGQPHRVVQRSMRQSDELELARSQELREERLRVDADSGRARHQRPEIDRDPRTSGALLVGRLQGWGDGELSSGSGPPAAGRRRPVGSLRQRLLGCRGGGEPESPREAVRSHRRDAGRVLKFHPAPR